MPVAPEKRIVLLRAQAVGLRAEAEDYARAIELARQNLQGRKVRLDKLTKELAELDKRLTALEAQKAGATSEKDAANLDRIIARYQAQRATVTAQADSERILLQSIEEQIKTQEKVRQAYLTFAEQSEKDADKLARYCKAASAAQ
jgi:uncharacterized protein YdiU (UPF0061 family)